MRDLVNFVMVAFFAICAFAMALPAFAAGTGYGQ
jgi:hypothetical protein